MTEARLRKSEERRRKVELLAQSFQKNPLPSPYKPRLQPWQPSSVWRLFPRQCLAISFAQSCNEDVHVFALEKENASLGQRMYLVTSYIELWHYYRTYQQSLMHCYEVIPEGATCKLYFDLEFHRPSNKGLDGKSMVSSLIQYVCDKLLEVYGITCSAEDVLNLDSSTEDKFSRHLIFVLPNAVFKDNLHVGRFIHAILRPVLVTSEGSQSDGGVNSVAEETGTQGGKPVPMEMMENPQAKRWKPNKTDLSFLVVKNKDGQECLFVDLGVYTKNRNFRLYKSSKVGKNAAFSVAEDNTFVSKQERNKLERNISAEERIFLSSLVCNVRYTGQRILTWDNSDTEESRTRMPSQQRSTDIPCALDGYQCSPYQEVDTFVITVIKKNGIQGSIRRWNYFVSEQLLVYDILKYRWCENVGRFHKSNNIMILVDLKEEVWYQKCHDPDCKNFRSSSYPLPQDICISHLMTKDEEHQAYLMDDVGNIEPSQASGQALQSTIRLEEVDEVWEDGADDNAYLEAMQEYERSADYTEISDQILLQCMEEFEAN